MEEKTINLGDRKITIHELLAVEDDEIQDLEKTSQKIRKMIQMSGNISDEEYQKITRKEKDQIMKVITELNGWGNLDFQNQESIEKKDSKQT